MMKSVPPLPPPAPKGVGATKKGKEGELVLLLGICFLTLYSDLAFFRNVPSSSNRTFRNRKNGNRGPETLACEDLEEIIPIFSEDLRLDPENGLRPWSHTAARNYSVQGLDENLLNASFRRHHVVFFGDSTLKYFTKWINLLIDNISNTTVAKLPSMNLTDANHLLNPSGENDLKVSTKGTHTRWYGLNGSTNEQMCYLSDSDVWAQLRQARPEILVVNQGLHWLHFLGQGRDNVPACVIKRWIDYEHWLEELVVFSEQIGVKTLLFKKTNRICDNKFRGSYRTANDLYRSNDSKTLMKCSKLAKSIMQGGNQTASKRDIENYCQNGTFNNVGSLHLNARLEKFVERWQQRNKNTRLSVGIFNDYDVQSCDYTRKWDGRHYHPLNLIRIRLLANMLQCI